MENEPNSSHYNYLLIINRILALILIFLILVLIHQSQQKSFDEKNIQVSLPDLTPKEKVQPVEVNKPEISPEEEFPKYQLYSDANSSFKDRETMPESMQAFIDTWVASQKDILVKAKVATGNILKNKSQQYLGYVLLNPRENDATISTKLCMVLFQGISLKKFTMNSTHCSPDTKDGFYENDFAINYPNLIDINKDGVYDFAHYGVGGGGPGTFGGILAIDPVSQKLYSPKNEMGEKLDSWQTYGSAGGGVKRLDLSSDSSTKSDFEDSERLTLGDYNSVSSCYVKLYRWDFIKKVFVYLSKESKLAQLKQCDDSQN